MYFIFMDIEIDIKGLVRQMSIKPQTIKNEILDSGYRIIFIIQNVESFLVMFSKPGFLEVCSSPVKHRNQRSS